MTCLNDGSEALKSGANSFACVFAFFYHRHQTEKRVQFEQIECKCSALLQLVSSSLLHARHLARATPVNSLRKLGIT